MLDMGVGWRLSGETDGLVREMQMPLEPNLTRTIIG